MTESYNIEPSEELTFWHDYEEDLEYESEEIERAF